MLDLKLPENKKENHDAVHTDQVVNVSKTKEPMSYTKREPITEDDFPLVSISKSGLHIESEKITERLNDVSLSASTIAALEQCPAKWAFEKYVKPEILDEELDTPGRRGSCFHDIMETFFKEDPEDRTTEKLSEVTKKVITNKYPDFATNPEVVDWVKGAIQGYYKMGGKPKLVNVANVPKQKKNADDPDELVPGLEIFVKGKLGEATRQTLGFIDRVIESPVSEDTVIIEDWKSGKVKQFKKSTKSTDGFNEVRQQIIYTMLMEQRDVNVSAARLIYPIAGTIVNVDINDDELKVQIIDSINTADKTLTESIENNTFEFGPNFLCSWCPLAKVCPKADLKPFKKATDAKAKQPEAEELAVGVLFR